MPEPHAVFQVDVISYLVAILFILFVCFHRFANRIPTEPGQKNGPWYSFLLFWRGAPSRQPLFPLPPRANTTFFKFGFYRTIYAGIYVAFFMAVLEAPDLGASITWLLDTLLEEEGFASFNEAAGPFTWAFIVVYLLPATLLRHLDEALHYSLYRQAAIPDSQHNLMARLRNARFKADPEVLASVRARLAEAGFDPEDIRLEDAATARSLWAKAMVILKELDAWEAEARYATAFVILREPDDSGVRTIDRVRDVARGLEGDARACFQLMKERPEDEETEQLQLRFREACKELLEAVYGFVSRVSLRTHIHESTRRERLRSLGFRLEPIGFAPAANDLLWLGVVIALIIMPATLLRGDKEAMTFLKSARITLVWYFMAITPVLLACWKPALVRPPARRGGPPDVVFPILVALLATTCAVVLGVLQTSWVGEVEEFRWMEGWAIFRDEELPWYPMAFAVAFILALRMTLNHPVKEAGGPSRQTRLPAGLKDALWCGAVAACVMLVIVLPEASESAGLAESLGERSFYVVTLAASVLGFLIPAWYRSRLRELRDGCARARQETGSQRLVQQAHGAVGDAGS